VSQAGRRPQGAKQLQEALFGTGAGTMDDSSGCYCLTATSAVVQTDMAGASSPANTVMNERGSVAAWNGSCTQRQQLLRLSLPTERSDASSNRSGQIPTCSTLEGGLAAEAPAGAVQLLRNLECAVAAAALAGLSAGSGGGNREH